MARRNHKSGLSPVISGDRAASMVSEPNADELEEEVGDGLGIEIEKLGSAARPRGEAGPDLQLGLDP